MHRLHALAFWALLGGCALLLPVRHAPADTPQTIAQQLQAFVDNEALRSAHVGVYVVRLEDGQTLFEHHSKDLFVPASNAKIFTSAAALHYLGPDYQFRTDVHGHLDSQGTMYGNLYLKGYGDPYLLPERLWYLANRLFFHGLRKLEGNIVVDDSFFSMERPEPGQEADRASYSFLAPAAAVSANFNSVLVHVQPAARVGDPAQVDIEPRSNYAIMQGSIRTVHSGRTQIDVDVIPYLDRSIIRLSGRIVRGEESRGFWRCIDNPPIFTGEILRQALKDVGIGVRGQVQRGSVAADAPKLASVLSPRLAEIMGRLNKYSSNFAAAQVAQTLGAHLYGTPGHWQKAQHAIDQFLQRDVLLAPGSYRLANASGLHGENRSSPQQIVAVLAHMYKQPHLRPEFIASMAVAGGSGTLQDRMQATLAAGQLRAKTGSLANASALSGYVTTKSGQTLAFSFMVNDFIPPRENVVRVQDMFGEFLANLDLNNQSVPSTTTLSAAPTAHELMTP